MIDKPPDTAARAPPFAGCYKVRRKGGVFEYFFNTADETSSNLQEQGLYCRYGQIDLVGVIVPDQERP